MKSVRETVQDMNDDDLIVMWIDSERFDKEGVIGVNAMTRRCAQDYLRVLGIPNGDSSITLWMTLFMTEVWRELARRSNPKLGPKEVQW